MLGVLRTDDLGLSLNPQPSLRRLEHLLDQMRGAGLTIEAGPTEFPFRCRPDSTCPRTGSFRKR